MTDPRDFGHQPPPRTGQGTERFDHRDREALYEPPYGEPRVNHGGSAALWALVTGVVSLFVLGLVTGPVAVWLGHRARRLEGDSGRASTAIVLGWVGFGLWLFGFALGYGLWKS